MKKLMKVLIVIVAILIALLIIVAIAGYFIGDKNVVVNENQTEAIIDAPEFEVIDQVSYFKDDNKFRVFVLHVSDTNWTEIKKHGDQLMHTDGRPTVAFYYTDRRLANNVTNVATFEQALEFALSPGCVAEFWKKPNGDAVFKKFPHEY